MEISAEMLRSERGVSQLGVDCLAQLAKPHRQYRLGRRLACVRGGADACRDQVRHRTLRRKGGCAA